jgi:hypothetical protein
MSAYKKRVGMSQDIPSPVEYKLLVISFVDFYIKYPTVEVKW